MTQMYTRREMLRLTSQMVVAGAAGPSISFGAESDAGPRELVAGQIKAAEVGNNILKDGGNAIDAAVAAALVAGMVVPHGCGVGGYGGHMMVALNGGKKITAIDFNTAAPAAARADMYPLDESGAVRGKINDFGWLAAGVPGTLAGLQLALDRYGTRSFRELVSPAIHLAEEGFPVPDGMARGIRGVATQLRKNAASTKLLFKDGEPLQMGENYRNPDLAKMLGTLTKENSVEPFYRGEIGRQIAEEFRKHGGLVTANDMAAYQAREVEPLEMNWRGFTLRTAPLTAGGLTVLEGLSILKVLGWDKLPATAARTHALVETLRLGWHDRLQLLGDPQKVKVPIQRLLSQEYAYGMASKVQAAVKDHRALPLKTESQPQTGTVHLNSVDRHGNMVALTLTHGNAFGACVTVEGLGLVLGHGMSRFNPHPAHPNSPGPGKRPLHNMCPTILLRDGKPVLAIGGTGGRMIPNAIFNVLTHFVGLGASIEDAMAAPRLHTEGNLDLTMERTWPEANVEFFKGVGYNVKIGATANVHAIAVNPQTGICRAAAR